MSFILDALRKSEAERQRESAPGLSHAPMASIRRETPIWTWLVIGGLSIALAAIGLAWWRGAPTGAAFPSSATGTSPAVSPTGDRPASLAADQPAPGGALSDPGGATRAQATVLRSSDDLAASDPSLPELRLEFLAYNSTESANSSAWINGRSYRTGERIAGGPELIEIRSDGVVLAYRGERYFLGLR